MDNPVKTIIENGDDGIIVDIECYISNSLPNIIIVGFANKSVDEAKERIRGAFSSSGVQLPRKRITINLAPADIPKEGSSFDLPMIVAIMQTAGLISSPLPEKTVIMGEVGLDGTVRPIRGIIGKILAARKQGIKNFWIPAGNTKQANLIPGINLLPIDNIKNLYQDLNGENLPKTIPTGAIHTPDKSLQSYETSFSDIVGQEQAKRAMLIAAAGHHNIMLNGPPGTGKSMLAKALPSIMPALSQEEMLEVTHLHSLSRKNFDQIITKRPLRAPHHSASHVSVVGGGQSPRPGEISLSHRGVLFFDEFPEFGRAVIEALRQPMEDRKISVARSKETLDFPAHFLLVATANPCPCGNFNSILECICLPAQITKYNKKISGPIIDRIDLYVNVDRIDNASILKNPDKSQEVTGKMSNQVKEARNIQKKRSKKLNSELSNKELKTAINLSKDAEALLNTAAEQLKLSARGYVRTLKVARTIADLEASEQVDSSHVGEALQYRTKPLVF